MKCSWKSSADAECGSEAMHDSIFCWFHNPEIEPERQAARVRGGQNRHRGPQSMEPVDIQVRLDSADGILGTLQAVGQALADGRIPRDRANAIAFTASTAIAALRGLRNEDRIKAIEERLGLREPEDEA